MSYQVIREYDIDGKLVAAGYEWGEPNDLIMHLSAGFILAAVGIATISSYVMKTHVLGGLLLLSGSALLGYAGYKLSKVVFRPRSFIFNLDGAMRMPHGVPEFGRLRAINGHHGKVGTIEKIRDEGPHGGPRGVHRVAMFSKEGHIVRISKALHPDDAHLVSVQLTAALQEIRDEIAWRARARGAR
ncbi:hypothetical protein IVB46_41820 [Bradyrhizobium sp. 61]|uniref:hypothetical protein n=1 Tax=Bradyrhizobium sp. 61 TaxID=2782679 RepID=UPI001FF96741|nr:hypothetical protein [Bradyrhizobium sp. 61]MCK1281773.1 hypothetical protein [Bradyrhizobium sp. 61]